MTRHGIKIMFIYVGIISDHWITGSPMHPNPLSYKLMFRQQVNPVILFMAMAAAFDLPREHRVTAGNYIQI